MKNNKFEYFLNFSLIALFLANLWVLVFNNVLTFFNYLYPPMVKSGLLRDIAFPNPAKIIIYLGLSIVFIFIIWLIRSKQKHQLIIHKISSLTKIIIFIVLLVTFMNKLVNYPLVNEPSQYSLPVYILLTVCFIFFIDFILIQSVILQPILNKKTLFLKLFFGTIVLVIAILTFEPHFPLSGHDYAFIFGPLQEILNHKTIYTDFSSQHGLLPIIIFTLLHKFAHLPFAYFPSVIWLLYIAQYFLSFYLLYKISRSLAFSLLGMFSIIIVNYFSLYHLPAYLPQTGPLRWLPAVISLLILLKTKKIDSKYLIFFVSLSLFWIIDSGIALALAFISTLGILWLGKNIDFKKMLKSILLIFIFTSGIFLLINFGQILLGYKWMNPIKILDTLNQYAALGIVQEPIPAQTYFWVFVLIYLSSILYVFLHKYEINKHAFSQLLFSANISLFSAIYYVGRSNPHNLFHIAALGLLNLFILLANILSDLKTNKIKIIYGVLLFILLIVYPVYERRTSISQMLLTKYQGWQQKDVFTSKFENTIQTLYQDDIMLLKRNIPDKNILILHTDDTYLLYLSGKNNLLLENPQVGILTQERLAHAIKNVVKVCPKKIAVDCSIVGKCPPYEPFGQPTFTISAILGEIQKNCKINYKPTICSSKLCIEETK